MSEYITDAMVEAAAKALDDHEFPGEGWESESSSGLWRSVCRDRARATLEAVAQLIAAKALRDAADAWQAGEWSESMPHGTSRLALILGMAQRAANWLRARADRIEGRP